VRRSCAPAATRSRSRATGWRRSARLPSAAAAGPRAARLRDCRSSTARRCSRASAARSAPRHLPVLLATASTIDLSRLRRVSGLLRKPYPRHVLFAMISRLLDGSSPSPSLGERTSSLRNSPGPGDPLRRPSRPNVPLRQRPTPGLPVAAGSRAPAGRVALGRLGRPPAV
jgi:hypothetical protein